MGKRWKSEPHDAAVNRLKNVVRDLQELEMQVGQDLAQKNHLFVKPSRLKQFRRRMKGKDRYYL